VGGVIGMTETERGKEGVEVGGIGIVREKGRGIGDDRISGFVDVAHGDEGLAILGVGFRNEASFQPLSSPYLVVFDTVDDAKKLDASVEMSDAKKKS